MITLIAYQIVEDTSLIANYKPTQIITINRQYEMLLKAGVINEKVGAVQFEVVGTTKRQL